LTPDHLVLLAQGVTDPSSVLYTYGPLGVFAVIAGAVIRVLFKRLEETLALEREGRKRAEDELRTLNASIRDQYVPALERATGVIAQTLRASRRDDRDHDEAR
jgi:hypothetical protein